MDTFIQTHEATIRLGAFFGIFVLMAIWEWRAPRRALTVSKALRWGISARLAVETTLTWREVDFSAPEFASREFRQGTVYLGLRHELSGGAWWSVGLRQASGSYPRFRRAADGSFETDHFERQELDRHGRRRAARLRGRLTPAAGREGKEQERGRRRVVAERDAGIVAGGGRRPGQTQPVQHFRAAVGDGHLRHHPARDSPLRELPFRPVPF